MKYTHEGLKAIRSGLGLRLSTIIENTLRWMSAKEMAKCLKTSTSTVYNIKNHGGDRCSLPLLLHVADHMEVDYDLSVKSIRGTKTYCCELEPIGQGLYDSNLFARTLKQEKSKSIIKGSEQWH